MFPLRRFGSIPYIIGHRGSPEHAPENTLASFKTAYDEGADLVEFDVHLSHDGHPVIIHDESLERTTNGGGLVREHALVDLKKLDAGSGQKVPTVDQLLNWAANTVDIGLVMEVKRDATIFHQTADVLCEAVSNYGLVDRTLIISFEHAFVHKVKMIRGDIATGILIGEQMPDPMGAALVVGADAVLPALDLLSPALVKAAHESALGIYTWVVDTESQLTKALECGVDGIGTNRPGFVREHLSHQNSAALRRYRSANVA